MDLVLKGDKSFCMLYTIHVVKKGEPKFLTLSFFMAAALPIFYKFLRCLFLFPIIHSDRLVVICRKREYKIL